MSSQYGVQSGVLTKEADLDTILWFVVPGNVEITWTSDHETAGGNSWGNASSLSSGRETSLPCLIFIGQINRVNASELVAILAYHPLSVDGMW